MAQPPNNRRRTTEQDARSGGPRARNAERQRQQTEAQRRQELNEEGITVENIDQSIEETERSERASNNAAARRAGVAGQAADDERRKKEKNRAAFNKAFAEARRRGKMTFSMNGKTYGTRKKGETKDQHKSAMEGKRPPDHR